MIPFSCFTSKNEIGKNSNDKISNENAKIFIKMLNVKTRCIKRELSTCLKQQNPIPIKCKLNSNMYLRKYVCTKVIDVHVFVFILHAITYFPN